MKKPMNTPNTMTAVYLTGHGGMNKLQIVSDTPVPQPDAGEVLIQVSAAGMNNTDINTRTGWYNQEVESGTTAEGGAEGFGVESDGMGDWVGGLTFPRIQGCDVVGQIVAVGATVDAKRIGERVIVQPYFHSPNSESYLDQAGFLGSEYDGGFAQFVKVPTANAIKIPDTVQASAIQLATLPCSGGTAVNMLLMAKVRTGDRMLVTGASGGVGTFLVQMGKYLGVQVIAIAGKSKMEVVRALGADAVIERQTANLKSAVLEATKGKPLTVVADVVGGEQFTTYLALLRRGGRYVTAGAIAGPLVTLDLRTLYLKNLEFYGSTVYRPDTFPTLLNWLAEGGFTPQVAGTYPLTEIKTAQTKFLQKQHVGSYVLLPPHRQ